MSVERKGKETSEVKKVELEEATKELIKAAMGRVREGVISNTHTQDVTLEFEDRLYHITDIKVEAINGKVESVMNSGIDNGLRINGWQLDGEGNKAWQIRGLKLPRDPVSVTDKNLHCVKGRNPEKIAILTWELSKAKNISESCLDLFPSKPRARKGK